MPTWLIPPLPVRAARQRVGCDHAGNQFALRVILLFIAHTCDRALAVGTLAQAQWLYKVCPTRLLYRYTFVCMNRIRVSKLYSIPATRTRFRTTLDAIVRVPHAPSLTRRLYSYIISLGVTILRLVQRLNLLSLALNQFEFVVGYRFSTQSFLYT